MVAHGDLTALHEPFCNLADFGETDVEGTVVHSGSELLRSIKELSLRQTVFFKDTTDHQYPDVLADHGFLAEAQHTFLIRRPEEIAASFYALQPEMTVSDIGLEGLHELYHAVLAAGGRPPVVIDSDDLVARPAATMAAYCEAVGVPFRSDALSWSAEGRGEWQRTDRWHVAVSNSTGFSEIRSTYRHTAENNVQLAEFSAHHRPFYEAMREVRLTVPEPAATV